MGDTNKYKGPRGLDSSGRLIRDAENILALEEDFHEFAKKAQMAQITTLIELGCIEHIDEVVFSSVSQALGLVLFEAAIYSAVDECINKGEDSFKRRLAVELRERVKLIKFATDTLVGFSQKGKDRLVNAIADFFCMTYAKNFSFYTVGIDTTIRDGIKAKKEERDSTGTQNPV